MASQKLATARISQTDPDSPYWKWLVLSEVQMKSWFSRKHNEGTQKAYRAADTVIDKAISEARLAAVNSEDNEPEIVRFVLSSCSIIVFLHVDNFSTCVHVQYLHNLL